MKQINVRLLALVVLLFPIIFFAQNSPTLAKADSANTSQNLEKGFEHMVFFNLKEENKPQVILEVITVLQRLDSIEEVKNFSISQVKDLNDPRALVGYELMIRMEFATVEDYQTYQSSAIHQAVKKAVGPYLSKPPIVYDHVVE
ncbi:MAG: Dabb family protein [Bacteroidia bacterium]